MMNYELSELAEQDFRDILNHTFKKWGKEQVSSYGQKIMEAFKIITENPHIGRPHRRIRVYHVGPHRIFYRSAEERIYIIRILHECMDAARHL